MTKDLTQGSPVRLILGFALPLLAGMLFQQLYNLVDTLIVGRFLGMEALAGVGATGSINFLVLGFCMGICSGFAIPVAQQFGAHEESRMREFVSNGTWLSIVFAVVMTVLTVVYCADILRLMKMMITDPSRGDRPYIPRRCSVQSDREQLRAARADPYRCNHARTGDHSACGCAFSR